MSTDTIKRVTGLLIIEAINSNPNGDPDRESDPRYRPDGRGEISPVSFKRKVRDLVEDKDGPVWKALSADLELEGDEFGILESRGRHRKQIEREIKEVKDGICTFTAKYWDGRVFGNTFLEDAMDKGSIKTGVAQFGLGVSISPIEIIRHTNTNKAGVEEGKSAGMAPMAWRVVQHGVYAMPFFINPSMAKKSGCTATDIELLKRVIPYAYAHTRSAIRPFVELRHAWWCEHGNALGSCSDFAIIDALKPQRVGDIHTASTAWEGQYHSPQGFERQGITCTDLMSAG